MGPGIFFAALFCTSSLSAAPNLIFDWLIRHSTTTNLNPDIEHIPHPGHDYPPTHIYNQNVWLTADASDRVVGLMLQNDTAPYDGVKSYALGDSVDWMSANAVTLDYVFSDVETETTHSNVLTMVDLVRNHADPKINQSRLVQYAYFPGETDESAHFHWITNRVNKHDLYMTSGVDVANPNCYPYEYFETHANLGSWGSYQCPDERSALFWAPLERYSTAKRSLPTGHQIIPWIAGFVPWDGYEAPEPGPEDRRALLQNMRLRGSDGYYVLVSWIPGLSDADYRAEMLDAWHDLDKFFASSGPLDILELGTDKTSGVNYSAARKGNRTRTLISNLSGSSASVAYPDVRELPDTSPSVPALTHESFEYLVYRPMDEGFESYDLGTPMDLQGFHGPSPDRLEVFTPPGVSNTSVRALGPDTGVGEAHAWWATRSAVLASNEVAVYSAKLYGAAGVGFAPLAVDSYVLANNGSTLPDTQRQGPYTSFADGKVVSRLSYSQGDDYEATNYTVVDGRWYEVQVVLDGSGGGPAITRTYIRDLSVNAAWTQLIFDNLATGGAEALTELPSVFTALANPATYNGWQVYATNDTCRVDDLWATLYPWIEGGDHGPADLFHVPAAPQAAGLLPPGQLTVTAFSAFTGSEGVDAFNGAGLTGDTHNNTLGDMWLSLGSGIDGKWIKVDLGGTYTLDHLRVWNFNLAGGEWRGLKQADLYVAPTDPGNNADGSATPFDTNGWTLAVADQIFEQSPGGSAITNTDAHIALGGMEAAFLAIRIDASYNTGLGPPGDVGLSEVQIMVEAETEQGLFHALTVNGGTGDGAYLEGAPVPILADAAPAGQMFDAWTGDVAYLADPTAAMTTVTMPATNVTVTATYLSTTTYPLTVNNGTGDGSYLENAIVPISADAAPTNQVFDVWTGDVAHVADTNLASTMVTMPATPVTITATYKADSGITLLDPSNLTVTAFSAFSGSEGIDAFSGAGLTGDTHNDTSGDMWLSLGSGIDGKWIKVDLGGTNNLDHLRVWNFNLAGGEWRGLKQADIYVALTDPESNINGSGVAFNTNGWTMAVEDQVFAPSPGGSAIVNTDPSIDLGGVEAAFLALRVDASYNTGQGSPGDVGLSEVQIYVGETVTDHDGDGLPSDWEIANGLDWNSAVGDDGADGNPDLDGATNYEEWIADTHPNDSNSLFVVTGMASHPDGSVDVSLNSSSARIYLLQGTNDLTAPLPWPVLEGPTVGTGGTMTFNAAAGSVDRAYAVEVRIP